MRRQDARRLLGPSSLPVFSVWAWLITAPFFIGTMGGFDRASSLPEMARGLAVAVAVHLIVGVVFLVANRIERVIRNGWTHAGFVAVMIAVIAVARPMLLTELQRITGGELIIPFDLGARIAMNLVTITVPLLVMHGLVGAIARSRQVRRRLETVLASRDAQASADDRAADALGAVLETTVVGPVVEALERARVVPFDAEAQAEALREVAHEVVRPLSHEVAAIRVPDPQPDPDPARRPTASPRDARFRVEAAPPWIPAIAFTILVSPTTFAIHGALGAPLLVLSFGVGVGLGWIATLLPLRRLPIVAGVIVVMLIEFLIGLAAIAVLIVPALSMSPWGYWISGASSYALIGWSVAVAACLLERISTDERTLGSIVAESDRRATAARANLRRITDRVGQVLHTDVQGRVIATTLRLRLGGAGAEALDDLITSVRAELREAIAPSVEPPDATTSPELLRRTIETWSGALAVDAAVDPAVWDWLGELSVRNELVLDAVSEALSNVVRHGDDGAVRMRLSRVEDGARLTVESRGRLRRDDDDGIGLRTLVERGAAVRLEQLAPDRVRLTVEIGEEVGRESAPVLARR